jgi:hypothetical protein
MKVLSIVRTLFLWNLAASNVLSAVNNPNQLVTDLKLKGATPTEDPAVSINEFANARVLEKTNSQKHTAEPTSSPSTFVSMKNAISFWRGKFKSQLTT